MPITKSAKKSLRVTKTKKAQNDKAKIALSKAVKIKDAKNINASISTIDKAAKIGIIHENKAARLKSRLMKKFGGTKAAPKITQTKVKAAKKPAVKKAIVKKIRDKK